MTIRTIFDGLFILGTILMCGYAIEFIVCKHSHKQRKRIFNVIVLIWFEVVGLFVLFAVPHPIGIVSMLMGIFVFLYDRRMVNKLLQVKQ